MHWLGGIGVVEEVKHHFAGLCYFKSGRWSRRHHFGWRGHLRCWTEQLRPAPHYCWGLRRLYVYQTVQEIGCLSIFYVLHVKFWLTIVLHSSSFGDLLLRCRCGEEGLWLHHQRSQREEVLPHWTREICRLEHSCWYPAVYGFDSVVRCWRQPSGGGWVTQNVKFKIHLIALLLGIRWGYMKPQLAAS